MSFAVLSKGKTIQVISHSLDHLQVLVVVVISIGEERCVACAGGPSVCYRHDGDGVCEEFERASSVLDCGFYTPEGYWDQWAHHAVANDQHQLPACPARLATGPPPLTQVGCTRALLSASKRTSKKRKRI